MLVGLLFFMPWLGLALGALTGAIAGHFTDVGIDNDFIKQVGASIEPGDSALFLLVSSWTEDKVLDDLKGYDAQILRTTLSPEQEHKLRESFGGNED
jgi:uncharacterized membrane protein